MKQYRVVGFDAEDEPLFEISVEAPNQAIARIMVLAQICRNFATAPHADRTDKLVFRSNLKGGSSCYLKSRLSDHARGARRSM
jgi:hypothetical protein